MPFKGYHIAGVLLVASALGLFWDVLQARTAQRHGWRGRCSGLPSCAWDSTASSKGMA
jgi:hypothetical protein